MVAEEGYVDLRGYRTWYRSVGERGTPLLAFHGGPGSTHHYFAPLERLAGERRVVVYDQIGCGGSDRPTDLEWSVELFRDEVAAIREQLGLDRIHLLGTSWGGMLALEHVLSGAEGVVSLILSSTLASIDEWVVEQKRLVADLPPEVRAVLDRHERAGTYGDPEYEEAMEVYFDRHFYRGWDVRNRLEGIRVPTLVVRGRYDMCTPPIARTLVQGIAGAQEVVLEESSHTPVLEETDRYLEVIGRFMREAEGN